jgi:ArsR family transcriptional regulator
LLRDEGEVPVGHICERLGLEQANVSQHLAVLRAGQVVRWRRDGNKVLYALRDCALIQVLDLMRRYFQGHLKPALELLGAMSIERRLRGVSHPQS